MITELLFKKRLIAFYSSWRSHKQLWGHSDIIVVSTTTTSSSSSSSSSSSRDFFLWLLEEDVAGTTAVFTLSSILFVCTQEESFIGLRSLGGYAMGVMNIPVSVELNPNPDDDDDDEQRGVSKLDRIIRVRRYRLYAAGLICTLTVGCIDEEIPKWKLLLSCLNGCDYFTQYRIVGVNCGVEKLKLELIDDDESTQEEEKEFKLQLETEKNGVIKERILSVPEQRLTFLYSSWRKYRKELWGNSDVLVVTSAPAMHHHYPVSSSFYLWLLGCDFPNTTAVFMDHAIYFFCPTQSIPHLCILGVYLTTKEVPVSVQPKTDNGDDEEQESQQVLNNSSSSQHTILYAAAAALWRIDRAIAATANDHPHPHPHPHPLIIGYIDGESPNSKLDGRRFKATNVISGFVKLLNDEEAMVGEGLLKSHQTQSYNNNNKDIAKQQVMSLSSSKKKNCNDAKAAASSMVSDEQQKDDDDDEENKNEQLLLLHYKSEEEEANKSESSSSSNVENNNACKKSVVVSDDLWDWEIIERAGGGTRIEGAEQI